MTLQERANDVVWDSDTGQEPDPAQPQHQPQQLQQEQQAPNVETNTNIHSHSPFNRNSHLRKPCRHKSLEQLFNKSNSKGDRSAWPSIARAGKWNSMEQVRKRSDFVGERTRSLPTSRWQSDEGINSRKGVGFWELSEKLNALRSSRESVAEGKHDSKVKIISASHEPPSMAVVQNLHSEIQTVNHEDLCQLIRRPVPRQRIFHGEKVEERHLKDKETSLAPADLADGSSLKRRNSLVIRRSRTKVNKFKHKQVNPKRKCVKRKKHYRTFLSYIYKNSTKI